MVGLRIVYVILSIVLALLIFNCSVVNADITPDETQYASDILNDVRVVDESEYNVGDIDGSVGTVVTNNLYDHIDIREISAFQTNYQFTLNMVLKDPPHEGLGIYYMMFLDRDTTLWNYNSVWMNWSIDDGHVNYGDLYEGDETYEIVNMTTSLSNNRLTFEFIMLGNLSDFNLRALTIHVMSEDTNGMDTLLYYDWAETEETELEERSVEVSIPFPTFVIFIAIAIPIIYWGIKRA